MDIFPVEWKKDNLKVKVADRRKQKALKSAELTITFNGSEKKLLFFFAPLIDHKLVLGMDFWNLFGIEPRLKDVCNICKACELCEISEEILPKTGNGEERIFHNLTPEQSKRLQEIKGKFAFSNEHTLSFTPLIQHEIILNDHVLIKQRPYHVSPYIQQKINLEIDRMLRLGIIEKAMSPTWLNPVMPVKKSNGKIRLVLDARKLNACTVKNTYPPQNLNRILEQLQCSKYMSTIDLRDAYYQIRIKESSRPCTAFSVSTKGTYQYVRMANGLCNAGSTLCELVTNIIGCDLEPFLFPYMDDFLVATTTFEEHMQVLEKLASRLKEANLTVSSEKSHFCMSQTAYVGYLISEKGLQANPEKIKPILEYPTPTNIKAVRRLIGMSGWYRRFVPNFADESAPITELLKKENGPFKWTENAQAAFERLKSILTSPPILSPPDFNRPFTIQSDASDTGVGAVLTQQNEGEEKVIAYFSAKLTKPQRNYAATEKECLGVILAIERFRPYVVGVKFFVQTDCASLLWLQNIKEPASRLARWALRLQAYNFELSHRKGKHNVVPDALSLHADAFELEDILNSNDKNYQDLCKLAQSDDNDENKYKFENNLLYQSVPTRYGKVWKIYIPTDKVIETIRDAHDDILAGHGAVGKQRRG